MEIMRTVALAIQETLGREAEEELDEQARSSGVIKRRRKFSGLGLLKMIVLTVLKKPDAKPGDYQTNAALLGIDVSREGIEKRFTEQLPAFLLGVLKKMLCRVVAASPSNAKLLQNFKGVAVGDGTTIPLPDELADPFPGCGGTSGSGRAALKIQLLWDLLRGAILKLVIEPGSSSDAKSPIAHKTARPGWLLIFDLGYFCLKRFRAIGEVGAFWISRLQHGTLVYDSNGKLLDLVTLLRQHSGAGLIDMLVSLGREERLTCRLVGVRVPEEVANRRRQKAREKALKHGRAVSREYLELQGWTLFVTNCDRDQLTWKAVVILYRARWQIELLFKLWKSHNRIEKHNPAASAAEQLAVLYAKLIGVILQHWILLSTTWTNVRRSLMKAATIVRDQLANVIEAIDSLDALISTLGRIQAEAARAACVKCGREHPSLFQLLQNPELLEYEI